MKEKRNTVIRDRKSDPVLKTLSYPKYCGKSETDK